MNQKDQNVKIVIMLFLIMAFCISLFLIIVEKYGLWQELLLTDSEDAVLQVLSDDAKWMHLGDEEEPGVGNVWTTQEYNARSWEKVTGEFKENNNTTEKTTEFFRYEFNIENPGKYTHIKGKIRYADAVIVYLNGEIIFGGNLPKGGYYSNLDVGASNKADTVREDSFVVTDLDSLEKGRNILAVEVHRKDKASKNLFFSFQSLSLQNAEYEENVPDTKGLMLRKGEKESTIEIDWLTDKQEAYKIEYMEGAVDTVEESTFSDYANTVIMGNRKLSGNMGYQKTGEIDRLKEDTDYVYRVMRIGGTKGSGIYQFHTAGKQTTTFLYAANPGNWPTSINKWIELSGKPDYLIAGKAPKDQVGMENEIRFRSISLLKEIPLIGAEISRKQEEGQAQKRQCRVYMDFLLISLSTADKDYSGIRKYIRSAMVEKNRKWNAVILNAPDAGQRDIEEEYKKLFTELDIDWVLTNVGEEYASTFKGEKRNRKGDKLLKKNPGEVLYIYGGSSPVSVQVSTSKIDIESEEQREHIILTKR